MRRRGGLLSLDQLIASDQKVNKDDFLPNALRMFVESGKTWALPAGLDPQVVYFNKDLFDRRKVAYPAEGWTRDDFAEKALALREASSGVFGYAVVSDFLDPILFVYQRGGKLFDNLEAPTRTTFDDPKTIEAINWYSELNKQSNAILTPEAAAALGGGNVSSVVRAGPRRDVDRPALDARGAPRSRALADEVGHGPPATRRAIRHDGHGIGLCDHDAVQDGHRLLAVHRLPQPAAAGQLLPGTALIDQVSHRAGSGRRQSCPGRNR